jgi:hypothetical protein
LYKSVQSWRRNTQLGGAIIVDPSDGSPADRVFVISIFSDPPAQPGYHEPGDAKSNVFTINGSSWPYTEKLRHEAGDRVRWRIIKLSRNPVVTARMHSSRRGKDHHSWWFRSST